MLTRQQWSLHMAHLPLPHFDPDWDYACVYTRINEQANALVALLQFLGEQEEATEEVDHKVVAKISIIVNQLNKTAELFEIDQ